MAIIRAIRKLLALPLAIVARLAGLLSPQTGLAFYRAAWAVSADGETAARALAGLNAHFGREAAAAAALAWMDRTPRPEIAAFAGLLALQGDDMEAAADWLARGRQCGNDRRGKLELLEFILAMASGPEQADRLAREFARRHDLAPQLSHLVLQCLMWDDLAAGRPDDAARRARHLLEVQDDREAACLLWALETQRGDPRSAEEYLRRAGPVPQETKLYTQVRAAAALARNDHADRLLAELEEQSPELARAARDAIAQRQAAP